jgi:hypothetical protein
MNNIYDKWLEVLTIKDALSALTQPHQSRPAEKYNFVLLGFEGLKSTKSTKKYKKFPSAIMALFCNSNNPPIIIIQCNTYLMRV